MNCPWPWLTKSISRPKRACRLAPGDVTARSCPKRRARSSAACCGNASRSLTSLTIACATSLALKDRCRERCSSLFPVCRCSIDDFGDHLLPALADSSKAVADYLRRRQALLKALPRLPAQTLLAPNVVVDGASTPPD
jgi:hypothetical protein